MSRLIDRDPQQGLGRTLLLLVQQALHQGDPALAGQAAVAGQLTFVEQQAQCMLGGGPMAEQQIADRQVQTQARQQIVETRGRQLLALLQLLQGLGEHLARPADLVLAQQQAATLQLQHAAIAHLGHVRPLHGPLGLLQPLVGLFQVAARLGQFQQAQITGNGVGVPAILGLLQPVAVGELRGLLEALARQQAGPQQQQTPDHRAVTEAVTQQRQ